MDYSQIASLQNLGPGSNGADVVKLQKWLIQNGFNIPDGATGYFGPETKAAVSSWQQRSGVDTQGNPGYFGPLSKSFIQKQSQAQPTSGGASQTSTQDSIDALHFMGFSDQQIASMSPLDKTNFALTGEYLKKQADLGQITTENNAASLQKAYTSAVNDPNIVAKYGDLNKVDSANFLNTLNAFQTSTDIDTANQRLQFQKQQKDLAEQAAAAGQAYSGFRGQAKKILDTQQSGIVKSSLSQLKQNLQGALSPLEQYYGSNKLNSIAPNQSVTYNNPLTGQNESVGYNPIGGVVGSEGAQKQSDIGSRQSQIYSATASPI